MMNDELRRVVLATALLGTLGCGVFFLAQRLSSVNSGSSVKPTSPDLRIERLKEAVRMAQQRKTNAEIQADSALFKAQQAAIRIREIETMFDQQAEKRAYQAHNIRVHEQMYTGARNYSMQVGPTLAAMGVSVPDSITSAGHDVIASELQADAVKFETGQQEQLLAHQYEAQLHEFQVACNGLKTARRDVEVAEAEIRQRQRDLEIPTTTSLASGTH